MESTVTGFLATTIGVLVGAIVWLVKNQAKKQTNTGEDIKGLLSNDISHLLEDIKTTQTEIKGEVQEIRLSLNGMNVKIDGLVSSAKR